MNTIHACPLCTIGACPDAPRVPDLELDDELAAMVREIEAAAGGRAALIARHESSPNRARSRRREDTMDDRRWTEDDLPEGVYRCPSCGRFVSDDSREAWGDVGPGGVRGLDPLELYCSKACSHKAKCAHGHSLGVECPDGCEN